MTAASTDQLALVPTPRCTFCGHLAWTIERFGRLTHKCSCPHRTDPFCQAHPVVCDEFSSTDNVTNGTGPNTGSGNVVTQAPSLEGIYQSPSGCNTLTFFDLATDAEVQVSSLQTFVTDRPLKVDAAPLKVRAGK